jgi:cyclohexyl-isocyanide hydratase
MNQKHKSTNDTGKPEEITVGFPLYGGFDSLDVLGPYQTFTFVGMKRYLVAADMNPVSSFEDVAITPHVTFADCPQLDVIFVPGGSTPISVLLEGHPGNNPVLDFLIRQAPGAKYVCSVCTGALLLAGAGLLDGHTVTTHWAYKDVLRLFPCHVVDDYRRYVQSGNRITGGGISSGLDEALYIVSVLYGVETARHGQLSMQYHPEPALHCGDPADSDVRDYPGMVDQVRQEWAVEKGREDVARWLQESTAL